jgi:O-antigen biosynthesis protein
MFRRFSARKSKAAKRLAEGIELLHNSPLVDPVWYRQTYADLRDTPVDVARHYLEHGAAEGRNPGPLFDTKFYLKQNPDVVVSRANPLVHYILYGMKEGRDPHPGFNAKPYPRQTPDVTADCLRPLAHYFGNAATQVYPSSESPTEQITRLIDERPPFTALSPRAPVRSDDSLSVEDRIRKSGLFDASWYLKQYPDVAAADADPLAHYLSHGVFEGRCPNPLFDTNWYLGQYSDVAANGINPLLHYIKYGGLEGRNPSRLFSTRWYLEQNPEAREAGLNPLAHYLFKGKAEGRLPLDPDANYREQVIRQKQRFAEDISEILRHIEIMLYKPKFVVIVDASNEEDRERTIASLTTQVYPNWSLYDLARDGRLHRQRQIADDTYIISISAGDILSPGALYLFASALNADPNTDLIYADEDQIGQDLTRFDPFYKPDWSPDYLESSNYIGYAACFRGRLAATCLAQSRGHYDFVLRFTELTNKIHHVREVLYHRTAGKPNEANRREIVSDTEALLGRLQRTGRRGAIAAIAPGARYYDIKIELSSRPLVSVIIPSMGKTIVLQGRRIDLLLNCIDTISARSSYKNLEFIAVDNGDLGEAKMQALRQRNCKSISYTEPTFNFSKKINLGASIATGEFFLLLNDDIEPISADWIERLLEHFEKPHVGVVGARLYYLDGMTQHVGVVLNSGNPDHVRRFYAKDDVGYFFSTGAVRNFSAVTGAVMMTRADVYRGVGGFNESLAVSYNDVDYCLKVQERELFICYAPKSELTHFESTSRKPFLDLSEAEYFHAEWARRVITDPFYNEDKLTVASPTFEVRHTLGRL